MHRLLVLSLLLLPASCRSRIPDPSALAERPDDFVVAAAVYTPALKPEAIRALPRAMRPARYLVEADGVLRAAVGPGSDNNTFPPPTRQLTVDQVDRLWRIIRDSGLLEPTSPYLVDNAESVPFDRPTTILYVAYLGGRTYLQVPLDRADPESLATERLLDQMAAYAWILE